jgi:hypothetical protein
MRAAARLMLGLTLAVPGLFAGEAATAQGAPANRPAQAAPAANQPAANVSHTHLGHVSDRFNDTPQNRGLLATATAEAAVATQHAGLAGQQPDNLEYMKQHTVHVLNAIDPTVEATGPGLGYGVKKAATMAVQHMEMAATAPNSSVAMGIHANHIVVATKNVVRWSDELIAIGKQIQASTDAATAAGLIKQMAALADKIANGNDVNTDGTVGWQEGEGGLRQAESISTLLKRAEGLAGEP